jgi:hypothetical protein
MSGLPSVTVAEARGYVAVNAEIDKLAVVIGCASGGTVTSGLTPFYLSGQSAQTGVGYGDGPDALCQIIEQVQPSPATKVPAAMYIVPGTTVGAHGTINVTGVTGTSVVTIDTAVKPYGTYEAQIRVVTGCTIGVSGGELQWSLDGGRNWSRVTALGTAAVFTIPNANVKFAFAAGTLVAGDIATVRTTAPAPVGADLDTAFAALATSTIDFGLLVCEFPMTAALAAKITSGLALLRASGRIVTALVRSRAPNFEASETDAAWGALIITEFKTYNDSSIVVSAAYGLLTDAMTGRQYLRMDLAQYAADVVRVGRSEIPNMPADRQQANFTLINSVGTTIGHDEGVRGSFTGLSNDALGNRIRTVMRLPDSAARENVYSTVPWVLYASDERIRNLPTRRVANAMERVAVSAGTAGLGGRIFYIPADPDVPNSLPRLTEVSRKALHASIYAPLAREFRDDIQNWDDCAVDNGLVQVNPIVTVTGGNLLQISVTLAPRVFGYLLTLNLTLAVQQ